ncbi:MAG: THUMP domain-containing protein [Promethearchaeota archaeon]
MQNFNLVVSTARDFETQAETELWFNLTALGDPSPIIYKSGLQGLILAYTSLPPRKIIYYIQEILATKDPNYIKFIQKIYPVDAVVATELPMIVDATKILVAKNPICQIPDSKFRITIRKRNSPLTTNEIISVIAHEIPHPVDLKNYDWNLQFEIVGNTTGIAILVPGDILSPLQEGKATNYPREERFLE